MDLIEALSARIPAIISQCPDYKDKIADHFRTKEDLSPEHIKKHIIINPKALFNLIESNFLITKKRESSSTYYELKTQILNFILFLITEFPLNARVIYEDAFLVVQSNKRINFITYLIKDVREAFLWQIKSNEEEKNIFKKYHEVSTKIFFTFCDNCVLRTSELKLIASSLTDFYYEEQLYTILIGNCFKLLSAALQDKNIMPYIYCNDSSQNDGFRVLFKNSKWFFEKGMTLFLWLKPQNCTAFEILRLKSIDDESLVIRIEGDRLIIITKNHQNQVEEEEVVESIAFPNNVDTFIGIELEREGIFISKFYKVNIRINDKEFLNVSAKCPKFEDAQFLADYSLLNHFIGKVYGIIINSLPELSKYEQIKEVVFNGPCKQANTQDLINENILDQQEIIGIFNPQRNFEGLLINYINNEHYISYEGRIFESNYHAYEQKLIDIYLPFLYFMSLIKEKDNSWEILYDTIFQHILKIVTDQNYQNESVMLLLYFLEVNKYKISQQSLNLLFKNHEEHQNFYLDFVVKYLDVHKLIESELTVDEAIEPFDDPVQKGIFLFHLQTLWKEKWNSLQGFDGWWSPHFFEPQNNRPFNPKDFAYSEKRETRVEWSVLNLVTKDFCKCFIQPIFLHPKYAQCDFYQRQYIKRESFNESFQLNLSMKASYEKIICKKVSNSKFDKFKTKIFGNRQALAQSPKKKAQQAQIKQFQSECLFIDILTVIQGSISIRKQGFIIFHSCHKNKDFDHMCAKAFSNQTFYYFSIPFHDVKQIYKKRFNASNNAVYIKTQDGKEMMFHFHLKNVDAFLGILQNFVKVKKDAFSNYVNSVEPMQWIDKFMSNYEYLQWLNEIAGRNYNDITQYPVLPWVYIGNETQVSEQNNQHSYRNLTKNIGSHGDQDRIRQFLQKYQQNSEEELFSQYHFGTHYSSSAIIFNFLIRIRPYSIGAFTLQSGKFDCADRIFYSYCGTWKNATASTTDIRELIPEIYTLPQMFINKNNYSYGLTQDKVEVDNAILPVWANNNPFRFVSELRKQLESRYVSESINHWIDLIYGYKQRGKDAIQHMNIFYPLTYQNCIDLDQVTERGERISFQTQIAHFGQNPSQIIGNNPHPARKAIKAQWQQKLVADGGKMLIQTCFLSKFSAKQQIILFNSVFEGKNAVLAIKFINNDTFFVLRRNEYYLFKVLNKKTNFLSKEQEVDYEIQTKETSLNLKELSSFLPTTSINEEIVIAGGFYSGYCQIIFLKEPKYNRHFQFHNNTITALNYESTFQTLFIGDLKGYLKVYRVIPSQKVIEFQLIKSIKAHDSKINDITINNKANIVSTCSEDGVLNLYNLYSHAIIRTFHHPSNLPIHFAHITTNPLYSVIFYSKENSTVYVYSINGQFLDSVIQKTGFIYNLSILKATDSTQSLVYLNSQRELFIWELPFLRLKRKVKMRKDQNKISCYQACSNGKILVTGTVDGTLQIIANPQSY